MKINPKKCKGTGKANGFNSCEAPTIKRTYGLCDNCYKKWLFTTPNGKIKLNSAISRAKKKVSAEVIKKENKRKKEWREKHKSIQRLIQEARKPFQKYIRERDKDKPCVSCGTFYSDVFDAGHYFKAEVFSGMIFDDRNVHKQCRQCNFFKNGNEANYRIGLTNRYGKQFVNELEESSLSRRDYKYTREELLNIKTFFTNKLKQIKCKLKSDQ